MNRCWLVCGGLLFPQFVFAQQQDAGSITAAVLNAPATSVQDVPSRNERALQLEEALALARRSAPAVRVAQAAVNTAEAQIAAARAGQLPSVSGSLGVSGFLSNGSFVAGGVVATQTNISAWVDLSVVARWTFFDFGRTRAAVEAAEQNVRVAREDQRGVERTAMLNALVAFLTLLGDQEIAAVQRETVRQRERQFEISRGFVEAGARAPIERTRTEVSLDAARLDLANAEVNVRNDIAALAAALALDPTMSLRAVASSPTGVEEDPVRAGMEAVANRPELASVRVRVQQAEAQLAGARANLLPSLSASLSGGLRYTERVGGAGAPSQQLQAGVTLNVPIYDPSVRANISVAETNLEAARLRVSQQELQVRTEAIQAAIALQATRSALTQAERLAVGAAANLSQAEGRYRAGAAPLLELVDAQTADVSARLSVARARIQWELARARLLAAEGRFDR